MMFLPTQLKLLQQFIQLKNFNYRNININYFNYFKNFNYYKNSFTRSFIATPTVFRTKRKKPIEDSQNCENRHQIKYVCTARLRMWAPEEIQKLVEGVKKYGNKWNQISEVCFSKQRTPYSLEIKWKRLRNTIKQNLDINDISDINNLDEDKLFSTTTILTPAKTRTKKIPWRQHEIEKLVKSVEQHGTNWTYISERIFESKRSTHAVYTKWRTLCLSKERTNEEISNNPVFYVKQSWTPQEVDLLLNAVETYGKQWKNISKVVFKSKRTPHSLLQKWAHIYKKNLEYDKKQWGITEDGKLREGILLYGFGNWDKIRCIIPHRSEEQLKKRWNITLEQVSERYKKLNEQNWSEEDEIKLFKAIQYYGSENWSKIMESFPDKSLLQVRNYYFKNRKSNPFIKRGLWTPEEINTLKESINIYGEDWLQIARHVKTRNGRQCREYCNTRKSSNYKDHNRRESGYLILSEDRESEERAEKVFYVKTLWKIDSLKDLTYPDDKVVCDLTVTDCKIFWTKTVTIIDLKRTKPENIRDISKFCGATWAALSGFDEYENHKLTCKIAVSENHARFSWRWSMENASLTSLTLKFNLGNISLTPISSTENSKFFQEWIDFFIKERQQFMNKNASLETRINDLQNTRDRAQERIEMMTADKINHETILMEKFKKVLNAKKKKIKKLMKALNTNGTIISTSQKPIQSPTMMISGEEEEEVDDSTSLDDILVPVDNNLHEPSRESQDYNDDYDMMNSKIVFFLCALFAIVLLANAAPGVHKREPEAEAANFKRDADATADPYYYYYYYPYYYYKRDPTANQQKRDAMPSADATADPYYYYYYPYYYYKRDPTANQQKRDAMPSADATADPYYYYYYPYYYYKRDPTANQQKQLLNTQRVWFSITEQRKHKSIKNLEKFIMHVFHLEEICPNGIILELDESRLFSSSKVGDLIREDNLIRVKRVNTLVTDQSEKNICPSSQVLQTKSDTDKRDESRKSDIDKHDELMKTDTLLGGPSAKKRKNNGSIYNQIDSSSESDVSTGNTKKLNSYPNGDQIIREVNGKNKDVGLMSTYHNYNSSSLLNNESSQDSLSNNEISQDSLSNNESSQNSLSNNESSQDSLLNNGSSQDSLTSTDTSNNSSSMSESSESSYQRGLFEFSDLSSSESESNESSESSESTSEEEESSDGMETNDSEDSEDSEDNNDYSNDFSIDQLSG
ncbi:9006_t:CDS:10 [Diversispora eburnea]|uniref:9006_t:CDS:1 n=1 Tax=Diversispora eburnea TaxID=1213867 RepID=A0A9N8ZJV4_9GLOM|nr:9006_t:CDS:10 [Diversispora eburnea]